MSDRLLAVVNFKCSERTAALLRAAAGEGITRAVILDNSCDDDEFQRLADVASRYAWVQVVQAPANLGFGAGVNRAVELLVPNDEDLVWIVNPDVVPKPGTAAKLAEIVQRCQADIVSPLLVEGPTDDPRVNFAGGTIDWRLGTSYHSFYGEPIELIGSGVRYTGFMNGAAPMMSARTWRRLGGFRTDYFLYWEDADLSVRATHLGLRMAVNCDALAWHTAHGASEEPGRSQTYYFYMARNRELFLHQWSTSSRRNAILREIETLRLTGRALRESRGRRQKARAVLAGRTEGRRLRPRSGVTGRPAAQDSAVLPGLRVIPELRAAHVEEIDRYAPRRTLFFRANYDLEGVRLPPHVTKTSRLDALRQVFLSRGGMLELHEPLWIEFAPSWLLLATASRLGEKLRGEPPGTCFYAIENNPATTVLSRGRRSLEPPARAAAWLYGHAVARLATRCVFGTAAAQAVYEDLLPPKRGPEVAMVWDLPARRLDIPPTPERSPTAIFVGSLEKRKGIEHLLAAWAAVEAHEALPAGARLIIIGDGPLRTIVLNWAAQAPATREVLGRRSRVEIFSLLRRSRVLVAPSVRVGRWREQVSRPIREALQSGTSVVTTTETGLAAFLSAHGHGVLPTHDLAEALPPTLLAMLQSPLEPTIVVGALPVVDGRIEADRLLHEGFAHDDQGPWR